MSDNRKTFYSESGDAYYSSDLEEAYYCAVDNLCEVPVSSVTKITLYSSEFAPTTASQYFPDGPYVIGIAADEAYDNIGEHCDDWLDRVPENAVDELTSSLKKLYDEWATKHKLQPRFWECVGGGKEINVIYISDTEFKALADEPDVRSED